MRSYRRFLVLLAFATAIPARAFARGPSEPPLFLGETLRYTMAIMGVNSGELTLSARQTRLNGEPAYKFEMSAISNEFLSRIFLVRDYLASWVDPESFRSLRFEAHTVEGKRARDNLIEFDYGEGIARRDGRPIAIADPTFDSLSSVYYIRTLNLDGGAPILLDVVSQKRFSLRVEVQGRETVATPAGVFRTIRVEPKSAGEGGLIGKGKNLILWVTDDEKKIPVQLRSKLKVGTLVGKLKSIERK